MRDVREYKGSYVHAGGKPIMCTNGAKCPWEGLLQEAHEVYPISV